mmetsp:Transcript_29855/g.45590  ORF Transcript_29855/g.45590 Transcript_29855/m.45590 type:complete len:263 (-) Transcript_29855:1937-2725(-)
MDILRNRQHRALDPSHAPAEGVNLDVWTKLRVVVDFAQIRQEVVDVRVWLVVGEVDALIVELSNVSKRNCVEWPLLTEELAVEVMGLVRLVVLEVSDHGSIDMPALLARVSHSILVYIADAREHPILQETPLANKIPYVDPDSLPCSDVCSSGPKVVPVDEVVSVDVRHQVEVVLEHNGVSHLLLEPRKGELGLRWNPHRLQKIAAFEPTVELQSTLEGRNDHSPLEVLGLLAFVVLGKDLFDSLLVGLALLLIVRVLARIS